MLLCFFPQGGWVSFKGRIKDLKVRRRELQKIKKNVDVELCSGELTFIFMRKTRVGNVPNNTKHINSNEQSMHYLIGCSLCFMVFEALSTLHYSISKPRSELSFNKFT